MTKIFKYFDKKKVSKIENAFVAQKSLLGDVSDIVIFDVGAYIGETALKYREIFPDSVVYCFEPFPDSFEKIKQSSNDKFIKPYQIAFSDTIGSKKLNINADLSCNSFFPIVEQNKRYYPKSSKNIETVEVSTTTIDNFCRKENIGNIDILKLDVEGAEILTLKGAHDKLSKQDISLIYAEVTFISHYENACKFGELADFLFQYNYTLFNFYGLKTSKNGQLRWGNAIFLSDKKRKQFEANVL